ncbi:MAG: AAA family ATPase [Chloroflexota bacterium]
MSIQSELRLYLHIIWRYLWIIALCSITAAFVALALTLRMTPLYTSGITVRVASAPSGVLDFGSIAFATRLNNTYVELIISELMREALATELGSDDLPRISAAVIPDTELIEISTTHADPVIAGRAARLLGDLLISRSYELYSGTESVSASVLAAQVDAAQTALDAAITDYELALARETVPEAVLTLRRDMVTMHSELYTELVRRHDIAVLNEAVRASAVTIIAPAYLPEAPSSPSKLLNTTIGFMAGMGLGLLLAFLFNTLDTRLHTPDDVRRVSGGLPLLTQIPVQRRMGVFRHKHRPEPVEAYRRLWATLSLMRPYVLSSSLLVTSPNVSAGKSTVVAGLGRLLASSGRRTLLIDLDVQQPQLHRLFSVPNDAGLSEVLVGEIDLDSAIRGIPGDRLDLLPAGRLLDVVNLTRYRENLTALLHAVGEAYDHVLLDSPALLHTASTLIAARQAAAVLLVIALNQTTAPQVSDTLRALKEVGADVAGVVVNRAANIPSGYTTRPISDSSQPIMEKQQVRQIDVIMDR